MFINFGFSKNKQNVQTYVEKMIKLENINRPWKKFPNLINLAPLIMPDQDRNQKIF